MPLGLVIGYYPRVAQYLNPIFELFRNTAALALLPVFILVLGIGELSKIAIVTFACFFPLLLSAITGVRTVDPLLLRSARSLGIGRVALFAKVVLALMLGRYAASYLDTQRAAHLQRMRELTEVKRTGALVDALLADHGLFHLEADLRWIDLTAARLDALATEVRP